MYNVVSRLISSDTALFTWINNSAQSLPFASIVIVAAATYLPYCMVAGFAIWLVFDRGLPYARRVQWFALSIVAAVLSRDATELIRIYIPRERPFVSMKVHQLIDLHARSFPSGHASFFFGFSTVVFLYNKKLGIVAYVLSSIVCVARVAAGVHYPLDVLVGAILGCVIGFIIHSVFVRLVRRTTNTI